VRALPDQASGSRNVIVLQRSLEEEFAYLRDIQRGLGELGILTLLAALLVGLFVAQKITHPMSQLVRGAGEIERGNYEYPIGIRTRDEIGYLARRFEQMREHERFYIHNLQEVAQAKSNFIDVAAHELRTPTTVILGYTGLLMQKDWGELTAQQREAVDAIELSTMAIVRIADDATSMAQVEGDRRVLDRQEWDVRSLLEEAAEVVRAEAATRQVAVNVEMEGSLRVEVDGPRLTQAFAHLVRNGIRFTPDGGSVRLGAWMEETTIVVEVRDTGIGIPFESREKLFERTLLVRDALHHHSSTGLEFRSTGLGLGLPITRGIVEAHGGSIAVTSEEGQGSVFTIRLPARVSPENLPAA
jgi:signal transduction histidine kinase